MKTNETLNTDTFQWTDDELGLLVDVAIDFKTEELYKGNDWEGIRKKYERIFYAFLERYPSSSDEGYDPLKYPHPIDLEEIGEAA